MANFYASYPIQGAGGGGGGTVTSVGLADGSSTPIYTITNSPVTSSGTLTFSLKTETANTIFAGPTTGAAAEPTFRVLVAADIPAGGNLTDVGTDGITVTGGTGAVIGAGTSLSQHVADSTHNGYLSSTDWTTFNNKGAGSVTSVAMSVPAFLSVAGSPVTSSGTLAVSYSGTALPAANGGTGVTSLGTFSDVGTDGITVTGGTGAVITSMSIAQHVADSTHNGYLSSTDWSTFNSKGSGSVTSVAMTVPAFLSVAGSPVTTTGTLAVSFSGTALPIANGGTAVTSVTTSPTASAFAGWDANVNFSADNFIEGYATTATAAGTTTLTVDSKGTQFFTGSTTQTCVLPVTSTLVLGFKFRLVNNSSGIVTAQSSGANSIQAMAASSSAIFTCILTSGTDAASWSVAYFAAGSSGTPTPTASTTSQWDANVNFSSNAFIAAYQAVTSAAGTTTLTVTSQQIVYITGTSGQSVNLPLTSTLVLGMQYQIINAQTTSSGTVGVKTSAGSTILTISPQTSVIATCIRTDINTFAAWAISSYSPAEGGGFSAPIVDANYPVRWDGSLNIAANNFAPYYSTTATAAGTTTLNVGSAYYQYFTGSTTQTCKLPVTSGLTTGHSFYLVNNSTGPVTVQSSGANNILVLSAGSSAIFTCILTSGTTAASWGISSNTGVSTALIGPISRVRSNATALTTVTTLNVGTTTSITIPIGSWTIYGSVGFTSDTTTTVTNLIAAISKTSATLPATDTYGVPTAGEYAAIRGYNALVLGATDTTIEFTGVPVTLTSATAYYLVAQASFGVSTLTAYGSLYAVRRID